MDEFVGVYKLARLGLLALSLLAIGLWLFRSSAAERLEEPARRMLEEDGE